MRFDLRGSYGQGVRLNNVRARSYHIIARRVMQCDEPRRYRNAPKPVERAVHAVFAAMPRIHVPDDARQNLTETTVPIGHPT